MIRVALDRSATGNAIVRTGIARYIDGLSDGLRRAPGVALVTGAAFDLWGGFSSGLGGMVREYLLLPARVRSKAIDVYHAPASRAPERRVPLPLVVTIHDFAAFEYPDMQGVRRGAQLRHQLRRAVNEAALIVVPSESIRCELAMRFPHAAAKARVVQHGVAPVFHRARHPVSTPTFVAVATLERRKNLATLIDAFALVVARRPGARLRLIGQPHNLSPAVRERLNRQGLVQAVSLEGYLSDEAIAAAYASATATVYPSLYEGFGLPIIESMAAGAPVIASDISAAREVAGRAAVLVDPLDAPAMGAAMLRLIEHPALNESLSAAGRVHAAAFTWERSAYEHINVYRDASL